MKKKVTVEVEKEKLFCDSCGAMTPQEVREILAMEVKNDKSIYV